MLISAIVPVYNLEHLVSRCLDSLVRQTHAELEIICIDDGSTDGSAAILEQAARQDKRIQVIAKRNEGLPMARKTGIDRASGEFIIHVDGDDYLEPDAIEGLAGRQHETDADIVVSDYFSEMEDGSGRKMCTDYHFDVLDGKTFLRALLTEEKYFIRGKLIRTSLCREISIPHDIHYTEDMVGMVQLAALARTVAKLDRPLYHYIKRSGAFTHAPGARSFKDWYRAVRLTGDYCRALPDGAQFRQLLLDRETVQADVYLRNTRTTGYYRKDIRSLVWKLLLHYRNEGRHALAKLPGSNRLFLTAALISQRLASCAHTLYAKSNR